MPGIPDGITIEDVRSALADLDANIPHLFGASTGYDLIVGDRRYPPKAVIGLAARRILGHPLGPYDFKGGLGSLCFRTLDGLGFHPVPKDAPSGPGTDWSEDEVRAVVEAYFEMLDKESENIPYSKADYNKGLRTKLKGRSKGSVEYKLQNVSGVLCDMGFPFISGYKPALNYQKKLLPEIVAEHLGSERVQVSKIEAAFESVPVIPVAVDFSSCSVAAPPREAVEAVEPSFKPRTGSTDFVARDGANRKLGRAGEDFVVEYERWRLRQGGRQDLAERVQHSSVDVGDGLGYDIQSFDLIDSQPIFIEVKTTNCGVEFPFFVSANEVAFSQKIADRFHLYRVFEFMRSPKLYMLQGSLAESFDLAPKNFLARRR